VDAISVVASVLSTLLTIYLLVLLVRLVLEYIPMFSRSWRPRGAGLVAAEAVYTVTDPPIKLFRRFIPPLRVGPVAIDFAFAATMLSCFLLLSILRAVGAAAA
jgi:YggT family protein